MLEGFTKRYEQSIVFVRATRAVGPDPQSFSVFGAPSLEPETEVLWSAGIVCDAAGRVLTCADGAQPTDQIELVTMDGAKLPARFLGQDGRTGLSLLEPADVSPAKPLQPLGRCASAAPTRESDWVVLLGPDPSVSGLEPRLGRLERILPATTTGGATLLRIDVEGGPGGCGAVVVDGNGDLVGMVVDRDPLVQDPGPTVQSILDEPVWALPRGLFDSAAALASADRSRTGFLGVQTRRLGPWRRRTSRPFRFRRRRSRFVAFFPAVRPDRPGSWRGTSFCRSTGNSCRTSTR
ncbi:MAG: S1C family serine protease [Candidatus Eisenbacteria bacterium]